MPRAIDHAFGRTQARLSVSRKRASRASNTMSYDLCEYNNSHPGMPRQSQALRLAIKQATNAKLVSQANKPQRSLSRRTLRNSDVASKSKGFFVKATGRGTRQMCSTNKYGFPIRHRTRRKTFLGFETGDIVKADIPRGQYEGRYVGRVTIRQRPSFILKGLDPHSKYLKRIHRSDGYEYQGPIKKGSGANAKQQKAHGHSTALL